MVANSVTHELIDDAIKNYESQFTTAHQQLEQLENSYQAQRTALVNTLNQIKGAIDGLNAIKTPVAPVPDSPTAVPALPQVEPQVVE